MDKLSNQRDTTCEDDFPPDTTVANEPASAIAVDCGRAVVNSNQSCCEGTVVPDILWSYALQRQNFFHGVSLAPDGSCLLTATEDCTLQVWNTIMPDQQQQTTLTPALTATCFNSIRSYAWYPLMDSTRPETCCFAAASRCVRERVDGKRLLLVCFVVHISVSLTLAAVGIPDVAVWCCM